MPGRLRGPSTTPRSVLVVEQRAHQATGHFPACAPQLETAFAELGFRVELLTSCGWSRNDEHPTPPFAVRRWARWARWLSRRLQHPYARAAVEMLQVRAHVHAMVPRPELVVILGWDELPALVAVLAPRRTRVLLYEFGSAQGILATSKLTPAARVIEARRRRAGGAVRIACQHELARASWDEVAPYLDPVIAPIAGVRAIAPLPTAREQLDLPSSRRVALFFGELVWKRRDLVLDAFAQLDDWTLVLGGAVADGVKPTERLRAIPNVVHDETRDLLFAAADLVVLSFHANYPNNSGTLMDAISWGVPVVCCDDAAVARSIIEPYQLGTLYANDDPDALAAAVRAAPSAIDDDDLARAREDLSNTAVARKLLEVMDV